MQGYLKETVKRTCRICGKEFETKFPNVCICSDECKKERKRQTQKQFYQGHKENPRYSRGGYKRVPYKICPICNQIIMANGNRRYHDDCLIWGWYYAENREEKEKYRRRLSNRGYCSYDIKQRLSEMLEERKNDIERISNCENDNS
jgi:hypothetical protein